MLAGGDSNGRDRSRNGSMSQHIVGAGGFLNPPWIEARQPPHVCNSLTHVPALVGVHHQLPPADLFADNGTPPDIVLDIGAHLDFEVRPTLCQSIAADLAKLFIRVTEPPGGSRVR